MSDKAKKLNELIEQLPVCKDGKAKVRELVQEMTGESLAPNPRNTPACGHVYLWGDEVRILGLTNSNPAKHTVFSVNGREQMTEETWAEQIKKWGYKYAAVSVQAYLANGGSL